MTYKFLRFDGTDQFDVNVGKTKYGHSFVHLADYKNQPFITGSFQTLSNNSAETEIYNMADKTWTVKEPYPYGQL